MAEEPMVKADLTKEMIEAGRQLLELLDRAEFRAQACFWFYFSDADRWRLVIASPKVRAGGPHAAYRTIEAIARKLPEEARIFTPGHVTAVKDTDPLVGLLGTAFSTGPGISGIRFTGNSVNGTFIDDAYIYRLAEHSRRRV